MNLSFHARHSRVRTTAFSFRLPEEEAADDGEERDEEDPFHVCLGIWVLGGVVAKRVALGGGGVTGEVFNGLDHRRSPRLVRGLASIKKMTGVSFGRGLREGLTRLRQMRLPAHCLQSSMSFQRH